jgi:hypothetical protein
LLPLLSTDHQQQSQWARSKTSTTVQERVCTKWAEHDCHHQVAAAAAFELWPIEQDLSSAKVEAMGFGVNANVEFERQDWEVNNLAADLAWVPATDPNAD